MKSTRHTRRLWAAIPVLALVPLAAALPTFSNPTDDEEEHELDVRDVVGEAQIGLGQAIAAARLARPGHAVEAVLEGEVEQGKKAVFFEVMVVGTDHALYEVKVDPTSGKVLSVDQERGREEMWELRAFVAALRHAELDLAQLIAKAQEVVKGTPVSAELEYGHGGPMCEVQIVNSRYRIEACLEARAGHLVELELEGEELGWEDEDDDEDDEDDDDEDDEGEDEDDDDDEEDDEDDDG